MEHLCEHGNNAHGCVKCTAESIKDDKDRGLYPKYRAFKLTKEIEHLTYIRIELDGTVVEDVTEPFFLLKLSDPYAAEALLVYADNCEGEYPELARDLRNLVENSKE